MKLSRRLFTFLLFLGFSTTATLAQEQHSLPREVVLSDQAAVAECIKIYEGLAIADFSRPEGPRIWVKAPQTGLRDFDSIDELILGQYNVENMYNYQGKWVVDAKTGEKKLVMPPTPKPERRLKMIAEVILRSNDDIMFWEEVEDIAAAQSFIDAELGGKYKVILIEGNDERGIDVAFVYKKDLPFDFEVLSHRNLTYDKDGKTTRIFSRDFVQVRVSRAGDPPRKKKILELFGSHGKSQRDSFNDPRSSKVATKQGETQAEIVVKAEQLSPEVPMGVFGDLNRVFRTAPELEKMRAIGLKDAFDLVENPPPLDQQITQIYFPRDETGRDLPPVYSMLDAMLFNQTAQKTKIVMSTEILKYKMPNGEWAPLARTFDERTLFQGSDHFKRRTVVNFRILRDLYQKQP